MGSRASHQNIAKALGVDTIRGMRASRTELPRAVIRIAGDSGDGIQLTGGRVSAASAFSGQDVATLADFPAEIQAPAGSLPGVSGFQVHLSGSEALTPGDDADVLVALNPAALKVHLPALKKGGMVIVNRGAFRPADLRKAGMESNPLDDGSLDNFTLHAVDMSRLTREALAGTGLGPRESERCLNFFALGLLSWLFGLPVEPTLEWIAGKFAARPEMEKANAKALRAGFNFGETARLFQDIYALSPAPLPPGLYRTLDGNTATALALATLSRGAGVEVFLGGYPITPASGVLQACARMEGFGITTFQAEDEIAALGAALGASFAGSLGVSVTSGPGLALMSEILGLAVMAELPLVVIDVQRGGPSTGLPTKTEQADLLLALHGRHGEAPVPVLAPATPGDCFWVTLQAAEIAMKYMTPVLVLSEGSLAHGTEPFRVPDPAALKIFRPDLARADSAGRGPYERDPVTFARPWILPGTPGAAHCIGGLEKDVHGQVSYAPQNHQRMVSLRAAKVAGIAAGMPSAVLEEGSVDDDILVVGWGSTSGAITQAVREERALGRRVASLHLRALNPLPSGLGDLLERFSRILVPELNQGQLAGLLAGRFARKFSGLSKVQGLPFQVAEVRAAIAGLSGPE